MTTTETIRFMVSLKLQRHDSVPTIDTIPQMAFQLLFREFSNQNVRLTGGFEQLRSRGLNRKYTMPISKFGCNEHCTYVKYLLRQAGFVGSSLDRQLNRAFCESTLQLARELLKSDFGFNSRSIPFIVLEVQKYVTVAEVDQPAPRWIPATKTSIEALKSVKVEDDNTENCSICFEQLVSSGTEILCMPCLHLFHEPCIESWLNNSHTCPLCRFPMPS